MDRLNWDETDFLGVTEVVPTVEDYEVRHQYEFERGGLSINLDVWQLESFISICIKDATEDSLNVDLSFYCRSGATVSDNVIKFADCVFVESRFTYIDKPEVLHKDKIPYGNDVLLLISKNTVSISIK